jgi:hypothetical protein
MSFNDWTNPAGVPEFTFLNGSTELEVRRGASLMGFARGLPSPTGIVWVYGGKLYFPGWTIWADPSIATDELNPQRVYQAQLGVSDASFLKQSNGANVIKLPGTSLGAAVDGFCVARSENAGLTFATQCIEVPFASPPSGTQVCQTSVEQTCTPACVTDAACPAGYRCASGVCRTRFIDKTGIAVDDEGRVWVAVEDLFARHQSPTQADLGSIRVFRSLTGTEPDWRVFEEVVLSPEEAEQGIGEREPRLKSDHGGGVWLQSLHFSSPTAVPEIRVLQFGGGLFGVGVLNQIPGCNLTAMVSGSQLPNTDIGSPPKPIKNAFRHDFLVGFDGADLVYRFTTKPYVAPWGTTIGRRTVGGAVVPAFTAFHNLTPYAVSPSGTNVVEWYACRRTDGYWGDYFGLTQMWNPFGFELIPGAPETDVLGAPQHINSNAWVSVDLVP